MVDMKHQQEGLNNTLTRTFAELFIGEVEVKVVEEKHDSALLKIKQKDNKVNALKQVLSRYGMGACAELCADQHGISREEQDNFVVQSYERAINAYNDGAFTWEIVPVR